MDEIFSLINRNKAWDAASAIVSMTREKRSGMTPEQWKEYIRSELRKSPIQDFSHLCPLTRRNFEKPRGYAGDAVMMDYIYGRSDHGTLSALDTTTEELYRYTTSAPASRAVRYRRRRVAGYIDEACHAAKRDTNILSVACGHLREADLSREIQERNFNSFIAFDQDQESLSVVRNDYGRFGIETRAGGVRSLISGRTTFEDNSFDLVYTAGLYDYLDQIVARRLTSILFKSLKSGGKLMVANFLPDIPDVGYMEGLMDWWLVYRSDEQMMDLASETQEGISKKTIFHDPDDNIVFLELCRR